VVHAFYNPLVSWLFVGAAIMVLGGLVALTDRHHRVGAPLRRLRANVAAAAAPVAARDQAKPSRGWIYLAPLLAFAILGGFLIHRLRLAAEGDAPNLIPSVLINKPAPAFDLPPLRAGESGFKTADLRGRVTLVSFFASWCGPCRVEHPLLPQVAKAGITVIGVDYKDKPREAKAWLAELGDPYRTVVVDANGRTGIEFGLYGVPESYLIDKQGVIRFKQVGPLTPEVVQHRLIPLAETLNK
jgi:DsbE subfamily thiol:disulfide oxidoreductase